MNWHSDFVPAPSQYLTTTNYIKVPASKSPAQISNSQTLKFYQPSQAVIYSNSANLNQSPVGQYSTNRPQFHQPIVYNYGQKYQAAQPSPINYSPSFPSVPTQPNPMARRLSHSQPSSPVFVHNTNKNSPVVATTATAIPAPSFNQNKSTDTSTKSLVPLIIDSLKQHEIKMVAFDFDCTIVNIHTGGQWIDSAEKLAEFVRPCFRELLPALLKCDEFLVCVVTFSPQEELIREVLRFTLKEETDLVKKIVIQGNTRELIEEHGIVNCYSNGKQIHLEICREAFESRCPKNSKETKIRSENILLIDDDLQNVQMALENGHAAFHVSNSVQLNELYQFLCDV